MGRPTDYTKEMEKKATGYLAQCADSRIGESNALDVQLPSVAGLAVYLGVARSTIYKWRDLHEEFSDMLEQILAEQEKRLLNNGLAGTYAASITKLVLHKHGYKDEKSTEHEAGETLADLMRDVDEEDSDEEEEEAA